MRIAVTGAASGIGSVIANELSTLGARVAICDKDAERVQAFTADHEDIFASVGNVSNETDVIDFFSGVEAKLGGLDALINNAGIAGPMANLEKFNFADWQETISVNLNGAFLCSKEAIPMLRASGGGSIINIGSTSSFFGTPLRSAYSATKWAMIGLTKTWAMEYGHENIRVNAICPGSVNGPRIERVIKKEADERDTDPSVVKEAYLNQTSMQTFIDPEEIVGMVKYLLSPIAQKVSGQAIAIDGHTESLSQVRIPKEDSLVKAVWYEQIGTADDVLRHGNIDDPEVSDGEVLVRIRTSGVNPSDVKTRGGARGELQFPRIIPHSDGAGKIEAVGNGVDKNRIGERVWLWNGAFGRAFGTCAEYISLPADQAVEMPENTPFEAGACMGIPASTAYHGVFSGGSVKNKTVLVTGGAGAVGHYAIQLAKWDGAQVITTVSGPEKGLAAEEAGADLVVNYKTDDVVEAVNNFTNGEGVDRIVEVEFGGNLSVSEQIIKTNGVIAAYGSVAVGNPELPFYNLMFKSAVLKMYLIYIVPGEARMKIIEGLTKALSENALVHQIAKSFDLTDTIQAHKTVEAGKLIGNTVINLA